jgi:hypothetical protein
MCDFWAIVLLGRVRRLDKQGGDHLIPGFHRSLLIGSTSITKHTSSILKFRKIQCTPHFLGRMSSVW